MASDPEFLAMNQINRAVKDLDVGAKKRVVRWVVSKVLEDDQPRVIVPETTQVAAGITGSPPQAAHQSM